MIEEGKSRYEVEELNQGRSPMVGCRCGKDVARGKVQ